MFHQKHIKYFLAAGMITMFQLQAQAQYISDFDTLKGRDDKEIVYKGTVTFEDIKAVDAFNLSDASATYKPNAEAIKNLSPELKEYELEVFLGTWCEDSHRMIPQLYRVLNDTGYPLEKLTLVSVDRDKKSKDNKTEIYSITLVPTIVVLQHGKEKGRITEVTDKSVEQDLWKIIHP